MQINQINKNNNFLDSFKNKYLNEKIIKTGTTIVGIVYETGVVLCADTRSTNGPIVANKNCKKIHYISDKIMCCGAGTAADTRRVTLMASKELRLFKYKHLKEPFITHGKQLIADYLLRYGGNIGAALILGGIDPVSGPTLISISPDGHSIQLDYTTMGSGSFAASSILESGFKKHMTVDEAINLGKNAIKAGILNDLYSGSNVDIFVIDKDYNKEYRNYEIVESNKDNSTIKYPLDSIKIVKEDIFNYITEI